MPPARWLPQRMPIGILSKDDGACGLRSELRGRDCVSEQRTHVLSQDDSLSAEHGGVVKERWHSGVPSDLVKFMTS
eukprot:5852572-Amphidinium_carterae.1